MAQKKFIKRKECLKNILPEEKLTFLDSSPTADISLPSKTIAVAMHGNVTVHGVCGTLYAIRYGGEGSVLLKIYDFPFNVRSDEEKGEIDGPLKTEHHYVDDLPSWLKSQTPRRVINRVEEIREGNLTDSNFL